jgi:hypothetical protein
MLLHLAKDGRSSPNSFEEACSFLHYSPLDGVVHVDDVDGL